MHIRHAAVEDSAALAHIQVDSYRSAYAGILPDDYLAHFNYEEQEEDWRSLIQGGTDDILLVAETEGGELAGYMLGRAGPTGILPFDSELVALHVRKAYQGRGAGRVLIAEAARRLHERGCRSLIVWVLAENPARAIYERLGGRLVGEKTMQLGEGDVNAQEVAYGWEDIRALMPGARR